MTKPKVSEFDTSLVQIAQAAKALAHPARLHILMILAEKNECICGEIVDASPLAQSTVSQHLKELRKAGLIQGEIEGPKTCYCLDKKAIAEAERIISHFFLAVEKPGQSRRSKESNQ